MQSENFDNKIRQSAEQHHPDYDGNAWLKMEKLLDRHIPQKEDRLRRVIFFLLSFLLLGGGAWLIISKPWQTPDQTLTATKPSAKTETKPLTGSTTQTTPANSITDKTDKKKGPAPVAAINKKENQTIPAARSEGKPDQNPLMGAGKVAGKNNNRKKSSAGQNNNSEQVTIEITDPGKAKKETTPAADNSIVSSSDKKNDEQKRGAEQKKTSVDQPANNDPVTNKSSETKKDKVIEEVKSTDQKDMTKKTGSKKKNIFFFSFSAAPDVSSVGLDNPGKIKLLTGAGFGYTFKDKLTVRTGFYTGRKMYSASPDDYKPAVTPPTAYLENIDADCRVYEIPVNLAYNFSQSKSHSLFAAAGLSSYIMKKEEYRYLYKYPGNPPITHIYTKTIDNEYKHYFSVLTLSAGYQYKINRTFSISAEPYFKLPLKGVGYGKVKLNSAGVMFSVNMSPFQSPARK